MSTYNGNVGHTARLAGLVPYARRPPRPTEAASNTPGILQPPREGAGDGPALNPTSRPSLARPSVAPALPVQRRGLRAWLRGHGHPERVDLYPLFAGAGSQLD